MTDPLAPGVEVPGPQQPVTRQPRTQQPGTRRPAARSSGGFYGWRVAGFCTLLAALTAPGQTAAVSALINPMIDGLGVSRSTIATCYLIGTLAGAAAMPTVGRALDRHGARRTTAVIGAVFAAALFLLSGATGVVLLTIGFVGIRLAGQGALGLAASTTVSRWFTRRRGLVLGLLNAVSAAAISLTPVLLPTLLPSLGWRRVWAVEAVVVLLVVVPVAWFGLRDLPSDLGQSPDGDHRVVRATEPVAEWGATRAEALRTPFFWVVAAAAAASGMLATAVAFHQIDLLGERGFSGAQAAANFVPQTVAGLLGALLVGVVVDRARPSVVLAAPMLLLAGGLVWAVFVNPGWSGIGFGVVLGTAGGSLRTAEAAILPKVFGTLHLGAMRGLITAVAVGSTAFGPVVFAVVRESTGGYSAALFGGAVLPLLVAVAAFSVRPPAPAAPAPS